MDTRAEKRYRQKVKNEILRKYNVLFTGNTDSLVEEYLDAQTEEEKRAVVMRWKEKSEDMTLTEDWDKYACATHRYNNADKW